MNRSQITFYLMGKKYGFDFKKEIQFVMDSQNWSSDRISDYQNKKLSKIINHAYCNVPFYNQQFKSLGLTPDDFKTTEDLSKLPVINKQIVSDNFDKFLAKDFKKYNPLDRFSGGTTGVAFKFYNDLNSWALNWALKVRSFNWGGYSLGKDKLGVLAGGSLIPQDNLSFKSIVWRFLQNYHTMPISNLSKDRMDTYCDNLVHKKIKFIRGYPSSIYVLAKHVLDNNKKVSLRGVFTTAEMLHNHYREVITKAFNCDVFDTYGCGEGMGSAMECEMHNGLHISFETGFFEILDKENREVEVGEEGEIVLTSLCDYAMPFIRYTPGDFAVKGREKCSCGRNLKLIDKIIGRTSDLIEFSNGTQLNGLSIPFEVWDDKIKRFQIVQVDRDEIEVLFIPKTNFNDDDKKQALKVMEFHCGKDVQVKIKLVDSIPLPPSGKFRYVISKFNECKS